MGCAAALATIGCTRTTASSSAPSAWARSQARHHADLYAKHPSLGDGRSIGLFGILELVRDRATYEPMAPYNGTSDEMKAVHKHLKDHGLYTFVRWNTIMTNPPLTITEAELAEAFAIIDGALATPTRAFAASAVAREARSACPAPAMTLDPRSALPDEPTLGDVEADATDRAAVPGTIPGAARDEANAYLVQDARDIEASADELAVGSSGGLEGVVGRWSSPPVACCALLALVAFFVIVGIAWELFKWVFGDPWRSRTSWAPGSPSTPAPVPPAPGDGHPAAPHLGHRVRARWSRCSATRTSRCWGTS